MEIGSISYNQFLTTIAVLAVLVGLYNICMTAVKNNREEQKVKAEPIKKVNDRLDEHESWFAADKKRLEALERQQSIMIAHDEQQDHLSNISVRAQLAMLRHMQHGNNIDGMKESEKEITDYLTGKE